MHIEPQGILAEWLTKNGRANLLAGYEVDEQAFADLVRESRTSHSGKTEAYHEAWAAYTLGTRLQSADAMFSKSYAGENPVEALKQMSGQLGHLVLKAETLRTEAQNRSDEEGERLRGVVEHLGEKLTHLEARHSMQLSSALEEMEKADRVQAETDAERARKLLDAVQDLKPTRKDVLWGWVWRILVVLLLGLLLAVAAKGQEYERHMFGLEKKLAAQKLEREVRNAFLLADPQIPHDPIIIEIQDEGVQKLIRQAGIVRLNFTGTGVGCTASGSTVTCNVTGGGGTTFDAIGTGSNTSAAMTLGSGSSLTFAGTGTNNASHVNGVKFNNAEGLGQIPIGQGDGTATWADPLVQGLTAHDAAGATTSPVAVGGYASAAAPADVSADVDVVRMWLLRNGSPVVNLASGGTLIDPRAITSLPAITGTVTANAGTNLNTSALALDATLTNRLPAGSTPADNESNAITASRLGTFNFIFDGTTWDRWTGAVTIGGTLPAFASTPTFNVGTFPDNEPFNVAQINGVTPLMGNGTSGTGSPRVTIASDTSSNTNPFLFKLSQTTTDNDVDATLAAETTKVIGTVRVQGNVGGAFDAASGAAPPANRVATGGLASGATGGFLLSPTVCDSFANINVATATTTLIVTGVSGRHVRICSLSLVTAAANNVAFISGTGATCGTNTTGMNGGVTAAEGWNFGANGGLTQGSGVGVINQTNATGDSVCVVTSAATQLSGRISYAIW